MTLQLPLPFELRDDHKLDSFVAGKNSELRRRLLGLGKAVAEGKMLWIHGAYGSGKTHLLQGVVAQLSEQDLAVAYIPAGAIPAEHAADVLDGSQRFTLLVIDDVEHWQGSDSSGSAEKELVRLYQERRHAGLHLVLSAKLPPRECSITLPDWRSRACGAEVERLIELDDDGKLEVLVARARRLGLELSKPVGNYLLRHGPRALPQMLEVLGRTDRLALAERRQLTVPLVKKALQELAQGDVAPDQVRKP